MRRFVPIIICLTLLAGCSAGTDDGVVDVAYIGTPASLYANDPELSPAAQLMVSAQRQGLVRLNAQGQVVPALAERWIVTDDGQSYIFRITEFDLPDGNRLTAQTVAEALTRAIARLDGTALGIDLDKVTDVRAMTGRVIEIRLRRPMPAFLNLLAQPELGIALRGADPGPMAAEIEDGGAATLEAMPPEQRGLAPQGNWDDLVSPVEVTALSAQAAARGFAQGRYDLLLGGRLETLPLAVTGALSRGTVRLDSAIGLFGIDVAKPEGFLATPENREALAMAIDRPSLVQQFSLGGWAGSTRLVAAGLPGDDGSVTERWSDLSIEQRRSRAASRVAQWASANGAPNLSISLPEGPGAGFLFTALARDFAAIGINLEPARNAASADLRIRDTVARYAGARWFLNQFNCGVSPGICSSDADFLVQLSMDAADPAEEASYLAEAEETLTATNLYIPLGAPVRWSQVRGGVEGFSENSWAFHPLFPLSRAPI